MATIGTFTKSENGFSGQIKTVTLNVKAMQPPPAADDAADAVRAALGGAQG